MTSRVFVVYNAPTLPNTAFGKGVKLTVDKETILQTSLGLEALKEAHAKYNLSVFYWPINENGEEYIRKFAEEVLANPNITKSDLVEYIRRVRDWSNPGVDKEREKHRQDSQE